MKELQIYIMRQIKKKINNSIPNFDFRNFFFTKIKYLIKKNKLS